MRTGKSWLPARFFLAGVGKVSAQVDFSTCALTGGSVIDLNRPGKSATLSGTAFYSKISKGGAT